MDIRGKVIGLPAIQELAEQFETSLTSTAIRYAQFCPDPVAIIVSSKDRIKYCFTSKCMKQIRADYIERATPVPRSSVTYGMAREGGASGAERRGTSYASAWFEQPRREMQFAEEVVDLDRYGRTPTVLHAPTFPDEEEWGEIDAEEGPEADKFNRDGKRVRF